MRTNLEFFEGSKYVLVDIFFYKKSSMFGEHCAFLEIIGSPQQKSIWSQLKKFSLSKYNVPPPKDLAPKYRFILYFVFLVLFVFY